MESLTGQTSGRPASCISRQRSRTTSRMRFGRLDGVEIRPVIHPGLDIVDRGDRPKYRSSWTPYAMPEIVYQKMPKYTCMLRIGTRNNRIPRKTKSHQWHFCPSPCPTALSNSAPRSQWSAMLTSFCDRPRGLCVVQCTSTDPNRWNHHGVGIRMALQQYSK